MTALLMVAGCGLQDPPSGVVFVNQTDVAVDVTYINERREESILIRDLDPGASLTVDAFSNDCSIVGTYLARDASGREVARRTGPICRPDKWVIEHSPRPD